MFDLNRGLAPLRSSKQFKFATWDVEASNWWDLQLIGFYDGERYVHFRNVGDFLNHILCDRYDGYRIFAHFGGRYDLNFVYDYLRANKPKVDVNFYCSGSMVVSMTIRAHTSHYVRLCDSYRLLPGSLRDLTKAFAVKHQKTEVDFKTIQYGKELIDYNEQDCRGLYEVIESFFIMSDDLYSETFATHALQTFRRDFLRTTIFKPPEEILDAARLSYHGGRVEVFKRKSSQLNAYDVNSMYPYVMLQPMPIEYLGRKMKLVDKPDTFGFVDATVTVNSHTYVPPLPVVTRGTGRLFFPTGTFRQIWTSEELIAASTNGSTKIERIHHAYYFHAEEIFAEYVMKFYDLKKNSTDPMRTIAKLLLNSLYGKFGQKPIRKTYVSEEVAPDGSIPIISQKTGRPTGFCEVTRESLAAHLLPHIASAVTAKARLHLATNLNQNSYYCDTDSVFTTETLNTSKDLGGWGEVGTGEAEFYQPKLYKFKGTWKAKGLNRESSIDEYVRGTPNHMSRSRSIKEALRNDVPACAHIDVSKTMSDLTPKRAWIANDTRPWDIAELRRL